MRERRKTSYLGHLDALLEHDAVFCDPTFPELMAERFDELHSLRATLIDPDPPQALVDDGTLEKLESTAKDIGSIISKFDLKNMDIHMAHKLLSQIFLWSPTYESGLCLKRHRRIYEEWSKPPPRKYYSTVGQHRYVEHLVEYLEQVVEAVKAAAAADDDDDGDSDYSDSSSVGPFKYYILVLQRMLQLVSDRLLEIPQRRKEDVDLKNLIDGVTSLAYEIEYAIDLFLVREISLSYSLFWLQDIRKDLKNKTLQFDAESGEVELIISDILGSSAQRLRTIALLDKVKISQKLDDILKAVANKFDICTWSLVSSSYKERKKEVYLQLLRNASSYIPSIKHVIDKKEYTSELSEVMLKKLVRNLLNMRHSYFIILKDVHDIEDLDDIRRVLPDGDYGSRKILLTTRFPELVVHCRSGSQEDLFVTKMSRDHPLMLQHTKPTLVPDMLGFKNETDEVLGALIGGRKQLLIISFFGMAGQGKTTLAKKLYNDRSVVDHFHVRTWGCVSQVYSKTDLLLDLLSPFLTNTIPENDEELAEMLYKSLMGRKFLVVLDDLWDIEAWDDLKKCFPDKKNGSRIIFTTRQERLALKAQSHSMLQPLKPLSDDESWELLKMKIFHEECCPDELSELGQEIAKYCKGLPLSVVLAAGLLAKMEKRKNVWREIAKNLSSRILNDATAEEKGIIELSYKHLPDPLKPCFLYFGVFLEDKEVPVQKLIRLWIAEGFIKHSDSERLEDVAEDYLLDLIGRSLIVVAREKSKGGVKSCRVHDLLREFALTKATQENFLQPIQQYDEHLDSPYYKRCLAIFSKRNCFFKLKAEPITYYQRRLCIYSKKNHFFKLNPFGPYVRSLLFFAASDMSPSYSYDISFIFCNFKLLRILNFENINLGNSFKEIDVLLHLRYLAVQGTVVSIPSSIANLLNLETFCVKSLKDKVMEVPDSIWNISTLRHLHINGNASFDMEPYRLENSPILDNLQTLSTPSLAYGDDMEKILRKLQGIRQLKCIFLDSRDDATNCNQFPILEFLSKLESLKVFYNGERRYPCRFNFPSNLKKLTLTNFRMPWNEISQLVALQNLEVLKLLGNAFDGERWEMEDEEFPNLKFLKLDSLNVVEWIAPGDNFPCLERLLLHKCENLKVIPPSIGEVSTLLMVEVKWCSRSAGDSTTEIQDQQSDLGNDRLIINVHPKILDLESSM